MKRHTPFLFVIALLGSMFGSACQRDVDQAQVQVVDSLLTVRDGLDRLVNAIDVPVYQAMDSAFRQQQGWLEEQLNDTLDRERALLLGNYYKGMSSSLGRVKKNYDQVKRELAVSREQLVDLRHDLERGLLPEDSRSTYLEQERELMSELHRTVDMLNASAGTARRAWDSRARVDSIMALDTIATSMTP